MFHYSYFISSEYSKDTIKLLFTSKFSKEKIFFSKFIAASIIFILYFIPGNILLFVYLLIMVQAQCNFRLDTKLSYIAGFKYCGK
ncbi:ABC transporter permease [Metabacillus arenae]|uniref:ABC transporter permease n=1 Tax=Metabacillus arenae TaxID=2771434 RepID=UPI0037C8FC80